MGPRRLGPSLPTDSLDSTADEGDPRPPMDLFKSIFASDEELSDSDTEESPSSPEQSAKEPVKTNVIDDGVQKVALAGPSSLFAHLFDSTTDLGEWFSPTCSNS